MHSICCCAVCCDIKRTPCVMYMYVFSTHTTSIHRFLQFLHRHPLPLPSAIHPPASTFPRPSAVVLGCVSAICVCLPTLHSRSLHDAAVMHISRDAMIVLCVCMLCTSSMYTYVVYTCICTCYTRARATTNYRASHIETAVLQMGTVKWRERT